MSRSKRVSFVVRVVQDPRGDLSGVIERVATGAKEAFTSLEVIGQVIHSMLRRSAPPQAEADISPEAERPEMRRDE